MRPGWTRGYKPLRDLGVGRLALGVIDYEGDGQRTRELIEAASKGSGGREFAVATECGMARIDERGPGMPSLEQLLDCTRSTRIRFASDPGPGGTPCLPGRPGGYGTKQRELPAVGAALHRQPQPA